MSKFTGRLVSIGIGKEGTRGTGVAATYWLPKTTLSFDDKVNKALVVGSYGNITDAPLTAYVVGRWAEGNIEGEINTNSFGLLLLALVGTSTPAGPADSAYTHAYTLQNDNSHDSLSIHVYDPIGQAIFELGMINSLNIDVALGEVVKYTANFMSKASAHSVSSPSYINDYRFTSKDLTFKVATNPAGIAAASKISVKDLSLTIEKNVEKMEILGTLDPEDILNKGCKLFGTLELNYEDRTWRDYMLDGDTKAMQIKLQSTRVIGAATNPKLNLIFPKVHFYEWESSRELDDIASQTINFEILFDMPNSRLWSTFDLVNTIASY